MTWLTLWSLLTSTLDDTIGDFHCLFGQFVLKFQWVKTCFGCIDSVDIEITFKLSYLLPSCPNQSTWWLCKRLTKEYNSLTDKIRAKYDQLDSGKFGSPGTPAFDAEAYKLVHLLAHVRELCIKLNLPTPKELYRPTVFKHWRHFSDQNSVQAGSLLGCGGCSFVPVDM